MPSGVYVKTRRHRKALSKAHKGKKLSEETKKKVSEARLRRKKKLGFINSMETRRKISKANKGRKMPPRSEEHKKHLSESHMGRIPWNKGKTGIFSEETLRKMSESHKGMVGRWMSKKRPPLSNEHKRKLSELNTGEKHPQWRGGISILPYAPNWTVALKRSIRERDDYTCQMCLKQQEILYVHHIDYNKKNCEPDNLVALCNSCHSRTNFNREYWAEKLSTINDCLIGCNVL